jgi:hypothetical protein
MIGVIVDGPGDFASLKRRFPGRVRVLKTDGPRGQEVTPQQIARAARKQVGILAGLGCLTVVVLTDFEERSQDYGDFCVALGEQLERACGSVDVRCCVANRMIENWYLADVESLSSQKVYIRNGLRQKRYEGTHGKRELKSLFERGYQYNEVAHGPDLFAVVRLDVASRNSESFRSFLSLFDAA